MARSSPFPQTTKLNADARDALAIFWRKERPLCREHVGLNIVLAGMGVRALSMHSALDGAVNNLQNFFRQQYIKVHQSITPEFELKNTSAKACT